MYFFTSDEHYAHRNIIKYCNRPFNSVEEMDETIIKNHNEVVKDNDTVVHGGDFTLSPTEFADRYVKRLNGRHVFISGSHDKWLGRNHPLQILELTLYGQPIVICHYAMHVWARSHYGAFHLYGHSHSGLSHTNKEPVGKVLDIGVDGNNFYPWSTDQIFDIMKTKPDNWNLLKR